MRVKILNASSTYALEEKINEFIKNREDILDIKYQGEGNHPPYSIERVSALILMK